MDHQDVGLTARSVTVLGLIAEGRSYDQILRQHPELTYLNIFAAAREALDLLGPRESSVLSSPASPSNGPLAARASNLPPNRVQTVEAPKPNASRIDGPVVDAVVEESPPATEPEKRPSFVERARATHGRAFTRWTRDEDARLELLFRDGALPAEISRQLDRHEGAIWRRLLKLGLVVESEVAEPHKRRGRRGSGPSGAAAVADGARRDMDDTPNRGAPGPTVPIVPGWDSFRDRLNSQLDDL